MSHSRSNRPHALRPRVSAREVKLSWPALSWYAFAHIMSLVFLIPTFSWEAVAIFYVNFAVLGISVTLFAHRGFAHRSFRAPRWFEKVMATLYTLSFNRCGVGLIAWVAAHKFHHAYVDSDLDPHSPENGFWHAFCGHFLWRRQDLYRFKEYRHYCPSLAKDRYLVWLERNMVPLQAVFQLFVFCLGGTLGPKAGFDWWGAFSFYIWGVCFRWSYAQLVASLIDTLSHGATIFKKLPDTWKTGSLAKNNPLYWTATLGNETWHNTHHAYPRSYRNGYRWYHWDLDSFLIYLGGCLKLFSDLQESNHLQQLTGRARGGHSKPSIRAPEPDPIISQS